MSNMDSGLKDKIIGKAKEVEGKLTGDKSREVEGKAQKTKGKVKAKAKKVKDDIETIKSMKTANRIILEKINLVRNMVIL